MTYPFRDRNYLVTTEVRRPGQTPWFPIVSMAAKREGPVWRVGRDHLCGYAMDFGGLTPALDSGFGCPSGNSGCPTATAPFFCAATGALMIFEVQTGVKENLIHFRRPQGCRALLASRGEMIPLRNQLASPFPAHRPSVPRTTTPGARDCVVSACGWGHSPPSSFGSVVPTGPAKMAPSRAATNTH